MRYIIHKQLITRVVGILLVFALLAGHIPFQTSQVYASQFDPSFILTNSDIDDFGSMSLFEIQSFLEYKQSYLASFITENALGTKKSAAELIFDASRAHLINPKWILVTLQKEQSLVEDNSPSQNRLDWAMGYAICDDCSKEDPQLQKFKGFGKQVDRAAARMRYYISNPFEFNFTAGATKTIDGEPVTIKNQATALLYNYTPHIHGNYNFWKIWLRWFATTHPDGSLLQVEGEPGVWLIQNGERRAFLSRTAFASRFNSDDIIQVSKFDINKYPLGRAIKLPNYSLVTDSTENIYLLVDDEKKKFESMEVFRRIGFNPEEVELVDDRDLLSYKDGRAITLASAYPQGQLIQDEDSGGVFYVVDGFKHPIVRPEILKVNFPNQHIIKGDRATLDGFITSNKVLFRDGKLVKADGDPKVYVISNGNRLPIANADTFARLGYHWNDIITTTQSAINLHPMGDEINLVIEEEPELQIANN